jgi:hypothetical protein
VEELLSFWAERFTVAQKVCLRVWGMARAALPIKGFSF